MDWRRPQRSPRGRNGGGFVLRGARRWPLELSVDRPRWTLAGPEATVLARIYRPDITAGRIYRAFDDHVPSDRVVGVKPSPEHSFAMIGASANTRRFSILLAGSGCAAAVWTL